MKKIYLALLAVMVSAIIPMQAMASNPQLLLKNDNGEVKTDITTSQTLVNADAVLPGITDCKKTVTQNVTLKADADVEASLRLYIGDVPVSGVDTPLNNYKITIKDSSDAVVYNSASSKKAAFGDTYKDMPLGTIKAGEEKSYTVAYEIVDNAVDVSSISMVLAAQGVAMATPTPVPTAKPTATPKPKFDFDNLDTKNEFIFDFSDIDGTGDADSQEPTKSTNEIKKVCGKDIPAGRFSVTGDGNLKITSANGSVKNQVVISENAVEGKSVKAAVVLLEEGDVITITPLSGDEKARLKFDKVTTAAENTDVTPVKPDGNAKTNPKTGDGGVGIVIGVAALAVLAFAGLEFLKRRSKTNN